MSRFEKHRPPMLPGLRRSLWHGRRPAHLRFTDGNTTRLFETGSSYFAALIERIDAAQREVLIETYIFRDDAGGRPIADALTRAAQRGVRVRLITDGVGTGRLSMFGELTAAGVAHRIYNPHLFGRLGFSRTHRKLAAIDGIFGYVGGINLVDDLAADHYRLEVPRWDFAVELSGPALSDLLSAFETQWRRLGPRRWHGMPAEPRGERRTQPATSATSAAPALTSTAPTSATAGQVAFVARDNLHNRRAIEKTYLHAIGQARHEVLLANPYFMPGRKLRRALTGAARRGLEVRLLIGRKEFRALDYAVPFLYHSLLKAGVHIAEYNKTLLHGKVAVIDGDWVTVGSSNLDALSLLLNHEANLVMIRQEGMTRLREAMREAYRDSRPIDSRSYAARPRTERALNWFAYSTYRLVMKILTAGEYD